MEDPDVQGIRPSDSVGCVKLEHPVRDPHERPMRNDRAHKLFRILATTVELKSFVKQKIYL